MNKTVTCNISGIIFNLEENGYDVLRNYLSRLKTHLGNQEGHEEIYSDIEMRIAELFMQRISSIKQAITDLDVDETISILGKPEDYIDEENTDTNSSTNHKEFEANKSNDQHVNQTPKSFMRDPEDGIIAGVCKGLSLYLGIDLVIVRGIFVALFFLTGIGVGLYIILWIITPKAKTNADKLKMKGEPVTVDTIKKEVQDAAERVKDFSKSKETRDKINAVKTKGEQFINPIKRIFGVFLITISTLGIIGFLTVTLTSIGIFTSDDGEKLISLYEFSSVVFRSNSQSILGWIGLLATALIPLIFFLIIGINLTLNIQTSRLKYNFGILFVFWIIGIGMLSITGFQLAREFTHEVESEELISSHHTSTLIVNIPNSYIENNHAKIKLKDNDLSNIILLNDDYIKTNYISIKLTHSKDSLFHVYSEKTAHGISRKKAYERISSIEHAIGIDSSNVVINPFYTYPIADKLRGQSIQIRIEVPENGNIEWLGDKKQVSIYNRLRK
jgi:phage shock protein PspC (stress-responsive transcriptional regulator)